MTDILIQPKYNIIIDATMFSTFQACARKYDFRFNVNMVTPGKSPSLEMGSVVHKFLEVYYAHLINGFAKTNAVAQGLTAAFNYVTGCKGCMDVPLDHKEPLPCKHKPQEYPGVKLEPKDVKLAFDTCEEYIEYYKNDPWIPREVEVVKSKVIYQDDNLRIMWKAKLDWLAEIVGVGLFSVDHKTMKQRRETIDLNNQFMGQAIVTDQRVVYVNKIGFQTSLKPNEKFSRPPLSYSLDRLTEWSTQIIPFWLNMLIMFHESGYFPPNFSGCDNKYGLCEYLPVCKIDRNMRELVLRNEFKKGEIWDISSRDE